MTEPLNLRLRAEAAEWDEGEPIVGLLQEAADAIETLVASVAVSEFSRWAANSQAQP